MSNGEYKRQLSRQRHEFLLTFFADQEVNEYAIRIVNGYKLIKQWNGNTNQWEVAIHLPQNENKIKSHYPKVSDKGYTAIVKTEKMPF